MPSQSDATLPSIPVARNTVRGVGPVLVKGGARLLVVVRALAQCGERRDAREEWADAVNGKAATFEAPTRSWHPSHYWGIRAANGKQLCPAFGVLSEHW